MPRRKPGNPLWQELELQLNRGRCAYCGTPATPDRPLTREHLIPRSRGGGRHDHRIIVPACARCNHRRGCQELILFLLLHPRRISSLLDHLVSLSSFRIQQIDSRVLADLYAALWVLDECAAAGDAWRHALRQLCTGRTIHRRRYAARRIVGSAAEWIRYRAAGEGPSCLLPPAGPGEPRLGLREPLEVTRARLVSLLSLVWSTPAEEVELAIRHAWPGRRGRRVREGRRGWRGDPSHESARDGKRRRRDRSGKVRPRHMPARRVA